MALTMALGLVSGYAEEKKATAYEVGMTGVTWAGCKKDVRAAFKKLDGVSEIKIAAGEKPGTQSVGVMTTGEALTKKALVKALGKKASTYKVKTVKKKEKTSWISLLFPN